VPAARCFCCNIAFQFGPYWYEGRFLPAYQVTLCTYCYDRAKTGWLFRHEARLLDWLKQSGLPVPDRLPNGRLPLSLTG
jgi:hypothetical protein